MVETDPTQLARNQAEGLQGPVCPDCQSQEIRASQSSYPMDIARIGASGQAFWRCENCGHRFLGPPTEKRRRSGRSNRSRADQSLNRSISFQRGARRWVFPVIVILSTILAVVYILERRNTQEQQQTFPES